MLIFQKSHSDGKRNIAQVEVLKKKAIPITQKLKYKMFKPKLKKKK